jgi:hypothetical protein
MKTFVAALIATLVPQIGFAVDPPACFLGLWKSDATLTLEDMRKHPEITEKARSLFENNFFGHLVVIYGSRSSASYFEDREDRQSLTFEPYDVVERGPDWMLLSREFSGTKVKSKLFCEGSKIYALVSKWEFREYFSPLP